MPGIVTEGRALFEAVSAQGLLGVRARQRTSPYLPGVRSRLWRTIAVSGPESVQPAGDALPPEDVDLIAGVPDRGERVLSLIRRLPLEFDDAGGG